MLLGVEVDMATITNPKATRPANVATARRGDSGAAAVVFLRSVPTSKIFIGLILHFAEGNAEASNLGRGHAHVITDVGKLFVHDAEHGSTLKQALLSRLYDGDLVGEIVQELLARRQCQKICSSIQA